MTDWESRETLDVALATVRNNLALWRADSRPSAELCLLQHRTLAQQLAKAFEKGLWHDISELRALLAPLLSITEGEPRTPLTCALDTEGRLALVDELLRLLPELFREQESSEAVAPGPVAVLDNPFFAAAAKRFAPLTEEAPTLTVPAFSDVCETVSQGDARFGILPLEDSTDGKLFHFYEQLDRFELHISHTADIPYPDGSKTIRFALFYRSHPPAVTLAGEGMLECSLFSEARDGLVELLNAALASGLSLRRMDAIPAPYGADSFFYRPTFRTSGGDARLFEAYLACFMPRTTVTARYIHI